MMRFLFKTWAMMLLVAGVSVGGYSLYTYAVQSPGAGHLNYQSQLALYRQAYRKLTQNKYQASLVFFNEIDTPLFWAKDAFYFHKGEAASRLAQTLKCSVKQIELLTAASTSFKQAKSHGSDRYLAYRIQQQLAADLTQLAHCATAKGLSQVFFSAATDLAALGRLDSSLVVPFFKNQLAVKAPAEAQQTVLFNEKLFAQPVTQGALTPEERRFVLEVLAAKSAALSAPSSSSSMGEQEEGEDKTSAAAPSEVDAALHQGAASLLSLLREKSLILTEEQQKKGAVLLVKEMKSVSAGEGAPAGAARASSLNGSQMALAPSVIARLPAGMVAQMVDPLWNRGDFVLASQLVQHLVSQHPDLPQTELLLFNEARLLQDQKKYGPAAQRFEQYLKKIQGGKRSEEALFQLAWCEMLLGRPEASAHFKKYLEFYPDGSHATGSRFFLAEMLSKKPDGQKEAQALHQELASLYPLSFYTVVTRLKAGEKYLIDETLFSATKQQKSSYLKNRPILKLSLKDQMAFAKYRELKEIGDTLLAERQLTALSQPSDVPFLAYETAYRLEHEDSLSQKILTLTALTRDKEFQKLIHLQDLFPLILQKEIKQALSVSKLSIDPLIILSLIRQESAFDRLAISHKDALGLMQLLTETAQTSARGLGYAPPVFDLFDKEQNVVLGTATLATLLKRYDGKLYYALAAYNAGPGAVDRWILARGELEPMLFIEAIPYKETRLYVLAILRNYLIYNYLYTDKPLTATSLPFELPLPGRAAGASK
jgi:TolA-binding protein